MTPSAPNGAPGDDESDWPALLCCVFGCLALGVILAHTGPLGVWP